MQTRYIIFAPSYNRSSGGVIVLHKLCHLINELGGNAVVYPLFQQYKISKKDLSGLIKLINKSIDGIFRKYKTNPEFNTPIYTGEVTNNDIVIYPELVFGNPLKAKNVIRWLLNKPGFFTGETFYGANELYFKFDHGLVNDFYFYGSTLSNNILNILHVPYEIYNEKNTQEPRVGVAYSIRKDKIKPKTYHPEDAILIDGLSHEEIAKIFKRVKQFISYDAYSAYSSFASLCGCESIVVPEEGVTKEQWYPKIENRYGIAYGFEDLEFANKTRHLKRQHFEKLDKAYAQSVTEFMQESKTFFNLS